MSSRVRIVSSWIVALIGLGLTVVLCSSYRPFGSTPYNALLLLGPILLPAGVATRFLGRQTPNAEPTRSAGRLRKAGLILLLIGGFPWIYTPLLMNGRFDSASGMIGTIIFMLVGIPGIVVLLIERLHRVGSTGE